MPIDVCVRAVRVDLVRVYDELPDGSGGIVVASVEVETSGLVDECAAVISELFTDDESAPLPNELELAM